MAIVSLGLFIGSNYIGSLSTVLTDAIDAIGIQIAVYYGLAGLTVVVAYRKVLFASAKNFLLIGVWPFVGAVFMFWILGEFVSTNTSDAVVLWVGLGGLAIGFIPLVIYWIKGSAYFKQRPRSARSYQRMPRRVSPTSGPAMPSPADGRLRPGSPR